MGAFRGMGLVTGSASRAAEGRRTRRLGSGSSCWSLLCRLAPTRDRPAVLAGCRSRALVSLVVGGWRLADAGHRERPGGGVVDFATRGRASRDRDLLVLGGFGGVLCGGGLLGFDRRLGEQAPGAAGEVALEAAQRSLVGLALGLFACEVFLRGGVVLGAGDRDRVQRPVELAVPAAVEAVLGSLPGGAWDRGGA